MATTNPVSEQDLEQAFRASPDFGVESLHEWYSEQIVRYVKRVTHGRLPPDELIAVYQETLLAVLVKARQAGFDPVRPLRFVYRVARNKGLDQLRALKHRPRAYDDQALTAAADALAGTETGHRWDLLAPADRREFREEVLAAMQELPDQQRIVARCFVDCFEDVIAQNSYLPLAEAVRRVTGGQETVASVKSAWHVVRKKIAPELARRGFN